MPTADYLFIDQWDVEAPIHSVFDALADTRTYPTWWTPTYLEVQADGRPELGRVSVQKFKAKLPYTLATRSRITRLEPPHVLGIEVVGDLSGQGVWTLTQLTETRVHVRFDWRVHADRAIIRQLTPVLRPLFRWNHNVAIRCAMRGLEPYAQAHATLKSASYMPR